MLAGFILHIFIKNNFFFRFSGAPFVCCHFLNDIQFFEYVYLFVLLHEPLLQIWRGGGAVAKTNYWKMTKKMKLFKHLERL